MTWRELTRGCDAEPAEISDALKNTIEGEIIPRLMMAHQSTTVAPPDAGADPGLRLNEDIVHQFIEAIRAVGEDDMVRFIDELRDQGASLESIYLDLLTPSARLLGEMWTRDQVHFVDVTIGLARIQGILRQLSQEFSADGARMPNGRKVVLSVAADEQHTCGIHMVAEFFRREGWSVWCGAPETPDEVADLVHDDWFDLAGFSLSRRELATRLGDEIGRVREASKNPDISVFVGGRVFLEDPALVDVVGADGFAKNGHDAVVLAEKRLELTGPGSNKPGLLS